MRNSILIAALAMLSGCAGVSEAGKGFSQGIMQGVARTGDKTTDCHTDSFGNTKCVTH